MIAAGRGLFTAPHVAGRDGAQHGVYNAADDAAGQRRSAYGGVLTRISGSTYNASGEQVLRTGIVMVILLAMTPLCRRWLTILPLGGDTARAVGMAITPSRVGLLLLAAGADGDSHHDHWTVELCRADGAAYCPDDGFRRAMPHMLISALAGGVLLVFADWCGGMVLFPYQIPAGLLSTFIGAPYFIYLLRKQSR